MTYYIIPAHQPVRSVLQIFGKPRSSITKKTQFQSEHRPLFSSILHNIFIDVNKSFIFCTTHPIYEIHRWIKNYAKTVWEHFKRWNKNDRFINKDCWDRGLKMVNFNLPTRSLQFTYIVRKLLHYWTWIDWLNLLNIIIIALLGLASHLNVFRWDRFCAIKNRSKSLM